MAVQKGGWKNTMKADGKLERIRKESIPASWLRGSFSPAREKRRRERHDANHVVRNSTKDME